MGIWFCCKTSPHDSLYIRNDSTCLYRGIQSKCHADHQRTDNLSDEEASRCPTRTAQRNRELSPLCFLISPDSTLTSRYPLLPKPPRPLNPQPATFLGDHRLVHEQRPSQSLQQRRPSSNTTTDPIPPSIQPRLHKPNSTTARSHPVLPSPWTPLLRTRCTFAVKI